MLPVRARLGTENEKDKGCEEKRDTSSAMFGMSAF
jgi:hypothetical protein